MPIISLGARRCPVCDGAMFLSWGRFPKHYQAIKKGPKKCKGSGKRP